MASTKKTSLVNKIITSFVLTTFLLSPFMGVQAAALGWENPGGPAVKMKVTDIVNAGTLTQIVGCTGIVDKVSIVFTGFIQKALISNLVDKKADGIRKMCKGMESGVVQSVGAVPQVGPGQAVGLEILEFCKDGVYSQMSDGNLVMEYDKRIKESGSKFWDECLSGVAYSIAKNTLVSMTRQAVNWVNSGFNGNPFFTNLTRDTINKMGRDIAEPLLLEMVDPEKKYPFGYDFANSYREFYGSRNAAKSNAMYELETLASDLSDFISDPNSYYDETNPNYKKTSKLNEKDRIYAFTNDFTLGGWDAWLALTQRDGNNPMGFNIRLAQIMEEEKEKEVELTKNELYQNNGFLSQKVCEQWVTKNDEIDVREEWEIQEKLHEINKPIAPLCEDDSDSCKNEQSQYQEKLKTWNENKPTIEVDKQKQEGEKMCLKWKTVTPGSLIKDKISNYLSSPERALEMADSINEVLYSLFDGMISKLQQQGLASMDTQRTNPYANRQPRNLSDSTYQRESFSSGYSNNSFDLARDLGNRFINSYRKEPLGTWDAQNNIPKLSPGVAPVELNEEGKLESLSNVYYVVSKAGKTKIIEDGFNGWAVGDRAFWDGEKWQNWKKDTTQGKKLNPIKERGVLQTQEDYIVAAREMLMVLPKIMPKLGELDYCIPGPNPGWSDNLGDKVGAFTDFAYSLTYSISKHNWYRFGLAGSEDPRFRGYKELFSGSTKAWSNVEKTYPWLSILEISNAGEQKNDLYKWYMDELFADIEKALDGFDKNYGKQYNLKYGPNGLMQKRFLQKEDTNEQIPNPAFLEAAEKSYSLLKKMSYYDEEIKQKTQDYNQNIKDAQSNKAKIQKIKDEVSAIIKKAQARRDARLLEVLNNESKRTGGALLTKEQYEKIYANCLEQEKIVFYEDIEIESKTGADKERCNDELDNDLDGKVDSEDTDCNPSAGQNKNNGGGSGGGSNKPGESDTGDEREKYNPRDEADNTEMQDFRY